jgi:hypothetical protein
VINEQKTKCMEVNRNAKNLSQDLVIRWVGTLRRFRILNI